MAEVRQEAGLEDVNAHLLAIGRRRLELEAIEVRMNHDITQVKANYAGRLGELVGEITALEKALGEEVAGARKSLFKKGVKTLGLLFGWVGFRELRGSVTVPRGTSEDEAVALLQKRGLDQLVRTRLEVNKEAIQAALSAGELTEEQLHKCGLIFKCPGEKFVYELERAKIAEHEKKG